MDSVDGTRATMSIRLPRAMMVRILQGCHFGPFIDWQHIDNYGMINKYRINKRPYAKRTAVTKDDGREHHGEVILDNGTHAP